MGKMKALIDTLVKEKANGNTFQELNVQMKLMLKGLDLKKINDDTPDDPVIIEKIYEVAKDFNINLSKTLQRNV